MGYLEEFQNQINNRDFNKFFQLWEEYCTNDEADAEEFTALLTLIKRSDFAKLFGQLAETALPLLGCVKDEEEAFEILKLIIDLQTTNSSQLAEKVNQALEKRFGTSPHFKERMRQVGMRGQKSFQGAISSYILLHHMEKGVFVFHTSGWGTGEIMDVSPLREQVAIEFENVSGIKHLTFDNAFKTLIPLSKTHFLARRFANADLLEEQAKKDPTEVLKALLRDLGPKTAGEIKDELCEIVIPEPEWARWWQGARNRLKKDTKVESPSSLREPFKLRKEELSHEDQMHQALQDQTSIHQIVQTTYSYVKDLPQVLRKSDVKEGLKTKLLNLLTHQDLTPVQELQICIFLETLFNHKREGKNAKDLIQGTHQIEPIIEEMDIMAFKKRALVIVREARSDWIELFGSLFNTVSQASLKDYILKELHSKEGEEELINRLEDLLQHPEIHPETFVWYFQKVSKKHPEEIPFSNKQGQCQFLEAFLILIHKIEQDTEWRDLVKKMYTMLTAKRFEVVRNLIDATSIEFIKEFLLLISKCHVFSEHDKKTFLSLAQVVHPSLAPAKKNRAVDNPDVLWTTQQGYLKTQERLKQIGTVEMIENAREVEAARALGDLRENAEYKSAVERRSRLQSEMRTLSKLLNKARVLTPEDVEREEIGVGSIVDLEDSSGNHTIYTILGPWDTDPDAHIISYQSQMAEAMAGYKKGDSFKFRGEEYTISTLKHIFE